MAHEPGFMSGKPYSLRDDVNKAKQKLRTERTVKAIAGDVCAVARCFNEPPMVRDTGRRSEWCYDCVAERSVIRRLER